MIVSVKEEIRVSADDKAYWCRGVMIPPDVIHRIDTFANPVLIFLYDSTTSAAKQIREVTCMREADCDEIAARYAEFERNSCIKNYRRLEAYILELLHVREMICSVTDERIASAMKYIQERGTEKITCREAAQAAFLSEGRFSHLFRAQTGMTFAAYLVYQRILNVYAGVIQGKTVTQAAIEAGFASSSHFADVNRRVFGMSASSIFHEMTYIKVI